MKKGIFLLFGGLPPTVIESQVILHVKEYTKAGYKIEVWCFADNKKEYSSSLGNLQKFQNHGVKIRLFKAIRPRIVFLVINALRLLHISGKEKFCPEFIHARTEYAAVVALIFKFFYKCKVIWDCRGDGKSENNFLAERWSPFRKFFLPLFNFLANIQIFLAKRYADRCVFVSEALKKIHFSDYEKKDCFIIPCYADSELFFFDSKKRADKRTQLNISSDEKVLIYSGGTSDWQFFPEVASFVKKSLSSSEKLRVIFLCPNPELILKLFSKNEQKKIIAKHVAMNEVNDYLNAADFAIFLRQKLPLNWVASPVKFSEYSLTGIPVIMTDAVEQCNYFSGILGNSIKYKVGGNFLCPEPFDDNKRNAISLHAKNLLTRGANWMSLQGLYEFD